MTINELKDELIIMEFNNYQINTVEYPNKSYVIFLNGKEYGVYYSERGKKRKLQKFLKESYACTYFLKLIKRG